MHSAARFGLFGVTLATMAACGSISQNLGDNGEANLDRGARSDAGTDSATPGDANARTESDAELGASERCGSTYCRAGAKCVASQCIYDCVGTQVPGDYATIQEAFAVLGSSGGTLCLGARTYAGGTLAAKEPVTIIGVLGKTVVDTIALVGTGEVDVRAIAVTKGATVSGSTTAANGTATVRFANCTFGTDGTSNALVITNLEAPVSSTLAVSILASSFTTTGNAGWAGLMVDRGASSLGKGSIVVDIDAADFNVPYGSGVSVVDGTNGASPLLVTLQNSYVHDSVGGGFEFRDTPSGPARSNTFRVINNTFVGTSAALVVQPDRAGVSVEYFNNLVVGNDAGIALNGSVAPTVAHGSNLLFGNDTNYVGAAVDGPGYIKADPALDMSTSPPSLGAKSPALKAGDAAHAPDHDYWGRPRTTTIDVGAIQSSL